MSEQKKTLRTPFYDLHIQTGAKMVDFAGWEMPLLYRGIIPEHQQTRSAASVFDVSHMGRLEFRGDGAVDFLEHVLTRKVRNAAVGQSLYSLVCHDRGGILDDVIVSRYEKHWLMVCNASNREKLLAWFSRHTAGYAVTIKDETMNTAMVAVQGPKVIGLLDELLPEPVSDLKRYHFKVQRYLFFSFTVFRSGYTGEDGVEIICGTKAAQMGMGFLFKQGKIPAEVPMQPAGLGCRDTLRLEAGMPLYGHELDESRDPISAGLSWAVAADKVFVGSDAIARIRAEGPSQKLVGLLVDGPRTPRQGMAVLSGGKPAGVVTSGTAGPTLGRTIAMAYVDAPQAAAGTELAVDLRGAATRAVVSPLPFYRRTAAS